MLKLVLAALIATPGAIIRAESSVESAPMYSEVRAYLAERKKEFAQIPLERKTLLRQLAEYVRDQQARAQPARLLFVCTHNSRRSQLGQLWAAAAAAYYDLPAPEVYSGGTEATAFNARAVAALARAEIRVQKNTHDENPVYHLQFSEDGTGISAFSKVYDQAPNPKTGFCAIMVCSAADQACPAVACATTRLAIAYLDPKLADGTLAESNAYDATCRQIAREMLFAMSLLRASAP